MKFLKQEKGMTLVEVIIVLGLMGAGAVVMMEVFKNQQGQTSKIELLYKSEQLRSALGSQFLDDPDMCKCLFDGASNFPNGGAASLTGVTPTEIGRYNFTTPGDCATATMPRPLVNTAGIDDLELDSVDLIDITPISGSYFGDLRVRVNSSKKVAGVNQQQLRIPVRIYSSNGPPGSQVFEGCSLSGSSSSGFVDEDISANGYVEFPNGLVMQWGRTTVPANSTGTVSFNKPFATSVYSVTVSGSSTSHNNAQDNGPAVYNHPGSTTVNNFRVHSARDESTAISWWAIGQ